MRYLISLLTLFITSIPASAQLTFGLEGGVLLNKVSFSKDIADSENRAGFFVGPKAKLVTPKLGLGVDAAVLYAQRSANIELYSGSEATKHMSFVEIPVNVRWEIGPDKLGLFVATGPQWDYYIGNSKLYTSDGLEATFSHSYFSWNIGVGLRLFSHLELGASYGIPMSKSGTLKDKYNTIVDDAKSVKMCNRQWQIRLNYFF